MSNGIEPGRFPLDVTYRGSCDSVVSVSSGNISRRITDWNDPSQAIVLIEAQAQNWDTQGGRECFRFMSDLIRVGTEEWYASESFVHTWKRHLGTSNFLFLDGGVSRVNLSEVPLLARRQEYEGGSSSNKYGKSTRQPAK